MHEKFYIISMKIYHIPGQCSAKLGEMSQILKQQ